MAIADDLDDLFTTPRARDDQSVSVEGVEDLFVALPDDTLEVGDTDVLFPVDDAADDLLTVPDDRGAAATAGPTNPADTTATSMNELLTSLADDLHKLASDIHKLLADDPKP